VREEGENFRASCLAAVMAISRMGHLVAANGPLPRGPFGPASAAKRDPKSPNFSNRPLYSPPKAPNFRSHLVMVSNGIRANI
jgi:hypothetical protein